MFLTDLQFNKQKSVALKVSRLTAQLGAEVCTSSRLLRLTARVGKNAKIGQSVRLEITVVIDLCLVGEFTIFLALVSLVRSKPKPFKSK